MSRLNHKGFSPLVVVCALLILGAVTATGYLVYTRKTNNKQLPTAATVTPASTTPKSNSGPVEPITLISSSGVSVTTTSLPAGWKMTEKCSEITALILTPDKSSVKCNTEDYDGYVSVQIIDDQFADSPKTCTGPLDRRDSLSKQGWLVSYDCEELTIDGHKTIKEAVVTNEQAAFTGSSTHTVYTLWPVSKTAVIIGFYDYGNNDKGYVDVFNNFARSLKILSE